MLTSTSSCDLNQPIISLRLLNTIILLDIYLICIYTYLYLFIRTHTQTYTYTQTQTYASTPTHAHTHSVRHQTDLCRRVLPSQRCDGASRVWRGTHGHMTHALPASLRALQSRQQVVVCLFVCSISTVTVTM